MNPCHHTLLVVTSDEDMDFICILDDGHHVDHRDDEGREWPMQACETDLHETMRPVLAIVGDGPPREFCPRCAGDLILHVTRRLREARS